MPGENPAELPNCGTSQPLRYDRRVSVAPFEVQSEELAEGIRILTVRGELDMNTAPQLEKKLEEVSSEDALIMVDLSECEFIDSTGIALIVRAWQRIDREAGKGRGRFILRCGNHQVRRLLKLTGVESTISMHEERDAALAELRG
jgi:anti-sigma B factor antagonist